MKIMERKGVSPVIATVLLIAIVIVLAVIIFLWARGFVSEKVQKFDQAIELSCDKTSFDAGVYKDGSGKYFLDITNQGDIPLYGVVVKRLGKGTVDVTKVFGKTIDVGESAEPTQLTMNLEDGDELIIVPILLGSSGDKKVSYTCGDEFGVGVQV